MSHNFITLEDVGLRFRMQATRNRSIKEATVDLLLRRHYGRPAVEVAALKHIHLHVADGERLGIVGDNGAGKSSLLKVMARIYPPTSGRIVRRGFLVPLLEIGIGFNAELSGMENIFLVGAIMGFGRDKMAPRVAGILDFAELHEFAATPVKYYSSGMAQRLAFSIATQIDPEILLLDEIFSVGDIHWVQKAQQRMQGLIDRARIMVLVSHQMELVERYCNRAIWMQAGQIVMDGPPAEVIAAYRNGQLPPQAPAPGKVESSISVARPPAVASAKPRLSPKWAKIALCLLLILAGQEALFRVLYPAPEIPSFNRMMYVNYNPIHTAPRADEWIAVASDPDGASARMRLDAYGFRTPNFTRDPSGPRTILYGDSFTEGLLVPEGETFADRLRAALKGRTELINLAVSATDMPSYLKIIPDTVPMLRPDHVVLVMFANDFLMDNPGPFVIGIEPPPPISPWTPRAAVVIGRARDGKPLSSWLWPRVSSFFAVTPPGTSPIDADGPRPEFDPAVVRAALAGRFNPMMCMMPYSGRQHVEATPVQTENIRRSLNTLAAFLAARHVRFTLAFIPDCLNVSRRYNESQRRVGLRDAQADFTTTHAMQSALAEVAEQAGFSFVDLTPDLVAADRAESPCYFPFDTHLSPSGHRAVAEALLRRAFTTTSLAQR